MIDAVLALCRMRHKDPDRQVSETDKRTWRQKYYTELYAAMQTHIALRDQGLLE